MEIHLLNMDCSLATDLGLGWKYIRLFLKP